MDKKKTINRREFIKTAAGAGLATVLLPPYTFGKDNSPSQKAKGLPQKMPRKRLGKTGVEVPILGLGGIFDILNNQIILTKAVEWGVKYWDTAESYAGENSEMGIGKFFGKNPHLRKEIFLVTKSHKQHDLAAMQKALDVSLERMKTDYVDMYFMHGVKDPAEFTEECKAWAEKNKKAKKIKFFGFSSHMNMEVCLAKAATLGWIDAAMPMCNFKLMQKNDMKAAIEACYKADIGLVAMKTQARGQYFQSDEEKKLESRFLQRGFTGPQVRLKAMWQYEEIVAICSQMPNLKILAANAAAALDKTKLTKNDEAFLADFANISCSGYCAGCAGICTSAVPEMPYVSDVMRYLMYYNNYGEKRRAKELFSQIPADIRVKLAKVDYCAAEKRCPNRLPIGELMSAAEKLLI